ncbi:MAG: DNA polymerase III subunit beta [Erysipelotrichaceae bacterium]|nr:DNA polymerase III subunit beta [Erysipelotrichaceae bacterium]
MDFIINRKILLDALSKVSRAVSPKNPIAALIGIQFDLKSDRLILTGSDSNMSIQVTIKDNLKVNQKGAVVLNSRYILEIVRKMDSEDIHMTILDGTFTRIEGYNSKFQLNGMSSFDYPRIDFSQEGVHFTIHSFLLKEAIEQTVFATSDKETSQAYTGVNFKAQNNILDLTATDTYRLAKKTIKTDSEAIFDIIIPKKSLNELSRIIEKDEVIDVYVSDRKALFILDDTYVRSRLIEGTYPDISRLIPQTFNHTLSVDSSKLLKAVLRATLLLDEKDDYITLTMDNKQVKVSSFSQSVGSVEENIYDALFNGDPLKISFKARYLSDAIRSLNTDKVILLFVGTMRQFIIKSYDQKDNIVDYSMHLILPVRTYD